MSGIEWSDDTSLPREHYVDLLTYPHNYFFELVVGPRTKVEDTIRMPLVNYVSGDYVPAYTGTFTMRSHYEEHDGYRRRVFKIAGRSGFTAAHLTYFKVFLNFMEKVKALKAKHKNAFVRGTDYRLVVNMPFEGTSEYCNITSFSWERDRSKLSLSYTWSLSLETTGFAARKWKQSKVLYGYLSGEDVFHTFPMHPCRAVAEHAAERWPTPDVKFPDRVKDLSRTSDEIARASGGAATGARGLNTGTGDVNVLATIYNTLRGVSTVLYDEACPWWRAMNTLKYDMHLPYMIAIVGWASNLVMEANLYIGTTGMSWKAVAEDLANYVTYGASGQIAGQIMELEAEARGFRSGVMDLTESLTGGSNGRGMQRVTAVVDRRQPSTTAEVLSSDTTVYVISQRIFGSRAYADAIMQMNGMADARTWGNGQPLSPGDHILVPDIDGVLPDASPAADMMGVDWRVENYDFVLNEEGDDFVQVTGVACYQQHTTHRLLTEKNENPVFPTTGITPLNGGVEPQLAAVRVAAEVQDQIAYDPRTKRIISLDYRDTDPSAVVVDVVVEPVASSRWRISSTYTG